MGFINNLSSNYLQSVLSNAFQNSGVTNRPAGKTSSGISMSPVGLKTDNQQLSPFAQLMSTLQQLQQSDPAKYQQVTQQIATNLQSAAQTAQADGNSTAATQLSQLATDFTNAATSGQFPNILDLARVMSGHHHHHHHHSRSASADSDSNSGASSTSNGTSGSADQTLSQFLSSLQPNGASNDALNPMTIIFNTLSSAGISGSNG